jgi:dienelactone hydrolase
MPPSVRESQMTLPDSGQSMTVERFDPERAGPAAAVVLLHGADGLGHRGPAYRAMARHLAGRGMRVLLPHYFERAGTPGRASFSRPTDFLGWMTASATR